MIQSTLLSTYGLAIFVLLTVLRQGTHLIHIKHHVGDKDRKQYAGEFVSTWLMYFLYSVCWVGSILSYLNNGTSISYYAAGVCLLTVGIWLRYLGVRELGRNFASSITIRSQHHLVTSGIYSVFRHPIHLALLLELTGMAIVAPSIVTFTALVLMAAVVVWRNRREDEILIAFFGIGAKDYCRRVPGMNPFPLIRAGIVEIVER